LSGNKYFKKVFFESFERLFLPVNQQKKYVGRLQRQCYFRHLHKKMIYLYLKINGDTTDGNGTDVKIIPSIFAKHISVK
jgi:hypothetical protein